MQHFKNIQDEIIARVNDAKKSLEIAVTWFTNYDIFEVIIKKLENPAFNISLIVLNDRINNKLEGLNFQEFINKGGRFYYSSTKNMVHHKFCIIDGKIVITGSYNWTYYAENRNWENIMITENSEIASAYFEEFEKVIQSHEQVTSISSAKKMDSGMDSDEYLATDCAFQAKKEEQQGNYSKVVKLYDEILRIDNERPEIQKARIAIVQKLNGEIFETCPFEIGIEFLSGYKKVIPAFTTLPVTKKITGIDPLGNSRTLKTTVFKNHRTLTILTIFSIHNLAPCPINTPKLEYIFTVAKNGKLTIDCIELNGRGKGKNRTVLIDLTKYQ